MKQAVFLLALLTAMHAHAATAPAAAAPVSAPGMMQVMVGLLLVLGVLIALAWSLKKMGAGKHAPSGALKIVGGINVGNRERILVVEVADQWIVVGVTASSINALSTMPRQDSLDLAPMTPLAKNFSVWLKQTIDRRNAQKSPSDPGSGNAH
ncbi:flagellar protein FliO/FliZ [Actimicrobium sp. GrIS 1.19]|uniref:flagellar biosynthetic protein FliO n=1 Tax=Actimicrobium sp. GrIS 1.19 TaxID=3071708 RepID=UPI002E04B59B|nr:flagellar protein FliO/FliZ [Actimicrobium sp. GrIS 1.19]